ncbi:MAG: MATE family efflux transporter [Planktomarina sp.]
MNMTHQRTFMTEAKALLFLGLPLIGSQVAQFAVHTTDTLMLGWYSVDALAQATLGTQVYFIAFVMGSSIAWAILPLVAKAAADQDWQTARRSTRMGLWLSTVIGLVLMIPMWFSKPILMWIGQDADLSEGAQSYLRIAGWGLIPFLWASVLKSYFSALERTGAVLWVSLLALLGNIVVNYALIFGHWGAPELGLQGAALASVSMSLLSFAGFVYFTKRYFAEHALFQRLWRMDMRAIWTVMALALPIAGTALAETGLFAASTFLMGLIGTVAVAAGGIAIQVAGLAFMFHLGLSQAATIHAGQALSKRSPDALAMTAKAAGLVSAVFAILVVLAFVLVPGVIAALFLNFDDPQAADVLQVAIILLWIAAAFQFVDAAQVLGLALLRGLHDTAVPFWLAFISYWCIGLPVSYVLGIVLEYGAPGVWIGMVAGLGTAAVLLWGRLWRVGARLVECS